MIKKTNTSNSQVVTNVKKKSKIPQDFEPVARNKQDEQKDRMFQIMGDSQNAAISEARFDDDEQGDDDAYQVRDSEPPEEVAMQEEDSTTNDE